jgi:hypothetical protein
MLIVSAHERLPDNSRLVCLVHTEDVHKYHFIKLQLHQLGRALPHDLLSSRTGSTSPTSCAATTRLPVALALHSTTLCTATTRLSVARALLQPCHVPSCRSTSFRSIALALALRLVTASRGATTRHPIAPALPRLCRAFRPVVSPLDFSSVGRTVSRRASGHCVSRRDYSSSRLHRLYCAYAVHPDAPSRRSTSRRSVALPLAVRPVTASHGTTTHRPDCTGSTTPMSCIRVRRLAARLLVDQSHWLSSCVRSLCLAA